MPKNILMVSDGKVHPPLMGRFWLRYALTGMQGFNFARVRTMDDLLDVDLSGFQGMVLYFHHREISEAALDLFENFIEKGGGVLAIHSVTASFKDTDRFTAILGGKFIGHGPVETYQITPINLQSEIFGKISKFQVLDELYLHDLQPDIDVQFSTVYQGEAVPVVWTRIHGEGRICFACPGHRAGSMRVPEYQRLLMRGLNWVTP